jgi:hypothetical protein
LVVVAALVGATAWLLLNRQFVLDQISVWDYHPSASVVTIEERSGLGGKGLFYFYASHPEVDSAADFNINCQRREAKSAILGCYNNKNIYIYNVSNAQLDGIEEVTAAHEMLHAVWDRMSNKDKASVGALLEAQYARINDPALKERMAYYDRTEPGEHDNELHSIIGTEVALISPELEKYYSQYFSNRSKVTALHTAYNSVFTQLSQESDALFAELGALSTKIDKDKAQYQSDATKLSSDIAAFNQKANDGGFTSTTDFNNQRAALIARSSALDSERTTINAEIKTYNDKNAQYQALIVQSEALNKSIDSSVAPAPSL